MYVFGLNTVTPRLPVRYTAKTLAPIIIYPVQDGSAPIPDTAGGSGDTRSIFIYCVSMVRSN